MIRNARYQLITLCVSGLVNSKEQAFSILDLNPNIDFNEREINRAFREKSKTLHPDKLSGNLQGMQMLAAAKDFLISLIEGNLQPSPQVEDNLYEMSYEDIANMRREMGREEFNKKFPGWEGEIKHEMGLDNWNKTFENYDPEYNPYDDPSYMADQDAMWDSLRDSASDAATALFEQGLEDNKINLHSNFSELLEQYPELIQIPSWIKTDSFKKSFYTAAKDKFNELILDNADNFEITFDDMISFPNDKIVKSFLSRDGNIERYDIPDNLLSDKNFVRSVLLLISDNYEKGRIFVEKYKNNKHFIDGILKAAGFLYYIRNNIDAKNLILSMSFNDNQQNIVNRWLKNK